MPAPVGRPDGLEEEGVEDRRRRRRGWQTVPHFSFVVSSRYGARADRLWRRVWHPGQQAELRLERLSPRPWCSTTSPASAPAVSGPVSSILVIV